jgi:hypothetical protein
MAAIHRSNSGLGRPGHAARTPATPQRSVQRHRKELRLPSIFDDWGTAIAIGGNNSQER